MVRILLSALFFFASIFAHAQSIWPITHLDEHTTVEMPYEGTLDEDEKIPGVQRFWTTTSDNEFQIFRIDLRNASNYSPNSVPVPRELSKLYDKVSRQYNRQAIKGKLLSQSNIMYAGTPARAAIYQNFNERYQKPACVQAIWICRSDAVYLFTCSYTLPETEGAIADKNRFFSSTHFEVEIDTKKL